MPQGTTYAHDDQPSAVDSSASQDLLRVHQVVPDIHKEASGPSFTVPALCRALHRAGADVQLHVLAPGIPTPGGFELKTYRRSLFFSRLGCSASMRFALQHSARNAHILHNHSLWMMPNVYPEWATRGTVCRLVTSPRGTLSPWALRRSWYRKRLMWLFCQRRALFASDCLHATAESELLDIRRLGLSMPVAVIPNGIDVPDSTTVRCTTENRRLLFLGRIHPKKGVDLLLQAWRRIQIEVPDWELQISGPDNVGYLQKMQDLASNLAVQRVTFPGPAYGQDKQAAYRSADLFVLPTRSENFGVTVAEALAHEVPVITTKEAPWQGLVTNDCGWWIDCDVNALADTLLAVMRIPPSQLQEHGQRGRAWMERDFSWDRIGQQMLETYYWLLGGGSPPPWVEI